MFGFGTGFQQNYVDFLENCFKKFETIKQYEDFEKLFPDWDKESFSILKMENSQTMSYTLTEWKLCHKKFRMLFFSYQSIITIAFLIPYDSYSDWVKAEFRIERGEYSGERGQLNPTVNPKANLKYISETSVGFPIVVLSRTEENNSINQELLKLIDIHFQDPEL